MSFREKLNAVAVEPTMHRPLQVVTDANQGQVASEAYKVLKGRIHLKLLDKFDLAVLESLPPALLRQEIATMVERLLLDEQAAVNDIERRTLIRDIQHEMLGFGPLELLMADPTVSDILVNSYQQIYVERKGKLELTGVTFTDEKHLLRIIDKIVSLVGRRIDESSPMVDARLPDGSRVNAVIPPVALDGPMMSIRRFAHIPLKMENLVEELKSLTPEMAFMLEGLCKAKVNMIISGGTGAGKTTLLNILSGYIPESERIVTIEDAAELQMQQPHVVRLETRPPNLEGQGAIHMRDLIKNCLRMRPERIIVGEVRGPEAFDLLQAMNTGHDGSMGTLHANSPREALARMESMITMGGYGLPSKTIREMITGSVDVIIQAARLRDGSRRITHITEVVGLEGDVIVTQDLFVYDITGEDENGKIIGRHRSTGIARPRFWDRARYYGLERELAEALDAAE